MKAEGREANWDTIRRVFGITAWCCHASMILPMIWSRRPARALEHAGQFAAGTTLDRRLFTILHSIRVNEVRSRLIRQGQGFVDIDDVDGQTDEHNALNVILANQIMARVNRLPAAQRGVPGLRGRA